MLRERRRGIKLVEVIVVTLGLGAVLGFSLRSMHEARASARRLQCSSNQQQVGLGLIGFLNTKNYFPNAGTFEDDPKIHGGDSNKSSIYRSIIDSGASAQLSQTWWSSWVVDIMPYIDI